MSSSKGLLLGSDYKIETINSLASFPIYACSGKV